MSISKKIQKNMAKAAERQATEALTLNPLRDLEHAVEQLKEAERRRQQISFLVAPEDFEQVKGAMSQIEPSMADRVKSSSLVQRGMMYRLDEAAIKDVPTNEWALLEPQPSQSWGMQAYEDRLRKQIEESIKNPFDTIKLTGI